MYSTSWSSIWSLWYSISSASEFFSVSSCDWFCNKKILSNQLLNSNDYSYMYDKTNHPSITILQLFSNGQTDNKLEYCVNPGPVPTCCAIIHLNCSLLGVLFQSVAVSTMRRQSARPEAFLHAEERPMFRGLRSASTERNQLWLGLPAGLLQSGGGLRITAAMARWWSSSGELRAMWPKKRRRLLVTMLDSGWQFERDRTSSLVMWRV